jgi:hypothetical protein
MKRSQPSSQLTPKASFARTGRQEQPSLQCFRHQHVNITKLISRLAEVLHINPSLFDVNIKTIIETVRVDPQQLCNLALCNLAPVLQDAQHPEVGVHLELRVTDGNHRDMGKYFVQATAI